MDPNKKTMRHFYCRDVLWDTFEQMANDFDCSIDYLVNEAMRHYARSKNYGVAQPESGAGAPRVPSGGSSRRPPPPPAPSSPPVGAGYSARRTMQHSAAVGAEAPRMPSGGREALGAEPAAAPVGATLFLVFNNQRIPIEKDQFIIGRGSKTSDLAIKDGNISRKHAAVICRSGTYYIKDLGSTNGIDYKGMRIDNKRIDEGDVFHLCDYELRFTYRG